ncbi:glyoxalase superfamily protein [Bizionia myxarmorum]|uniref:Bleomycin resistance protein n=1 Tax=Bizionia myxarmorum TaxID=291186 RepID=A0A5D0RFS1_9FLAO|nr:glyoxalase superfamily protein [Bizionia myxarmorum]TYB79558.1 glyoxalase/bleomycin resistance/extradiol dioxygenase family protein [Bizionia myxarmorum]
MEKAHLHQIHPVLPVQDMVSALFFYVHKLGFEIAFADSPKEPTYAGIRRGAIEIHLQKQDKKSGQSGLGAANLRIVVQNMERLYVEYEANGVFQGPVQITKTAFGTKEFTVIDMHQNSLTFYAQSS